VCECSGQSADDGETVVLPQSYRALIAGNPKIELQGGKATPARSLQRMRTHRPCHPASTGVCRDNIAAIRDMATATATVGAQVMGADDLSSSTYDKAVPKPPESLQSDIVMTGRGDPRPSRIG
jgi:hypothetical protein